MKYYSDATRILFKFKKKAASSITDPLLWESTGDPWFLAQMANYVLSLSEYINHVSRKVIHWTSLNVVIFFATYLQLLLFLQVIAT